MHDKIIHVYTDGGIRPGSSMPQGTGYGGTGWTCKGSMKLGTGCGKCICCIDELTTNSDGKEAP